MTAPEQWQSIMQHLDVSDGNLTADVETILESLMEQQDLIRWIVGDTLLRVGKSDESIDYFTKVARCKPHTLSSHITTCKIWESETRWQLLSDYPLLSYSLLKELNSTARRYGMDTAVEYAKRAGNEAWTVKELKRHLAIELNDNDPKPRHKELYELCATIRKIDGNTHLVIEGDLPDLETGEQFAVKIYEVVTV